MNEMLRGATIERRPGSCLGPSQGVFAWRDLYTSSYRMNSLCSCTFNVDRLMCVSNMPGFSLPEQRRLTKHSGQSRGLLHMAGLQFNWLHQLKPEGRQTQVHSDRVSKMYREVLARHTSLVVDVQRGSDSRQCQVIIMTACDLLVIATIHVQDLSLGL